MPENEIMAELRTARDAYPKRFDYDLRVILGDLQKKQGERTDREIVAATPRRIPPLGGPAKKFA